MPNETRPRRESTNSSRLRGKAAQAAPVPSDDAARLRTRIAARPADPRRRRSASTGPTTAGPRDSRESRRPRRDRDAAPAGPERGMSLRDRLTRPAIATATATLRRPPLAHRPP